MAPKKEDATGAEAAVKSAADKVATSDKFANVKGLNITQRMLLVMSEVDYVQKAEKPVDGKYRPVRHDDVTAKVRPILVKYGVLVLPSVVAHGVVEQWDQMNKFKEMTRHRLTEASVDVVFVNADDKTDTYTIRMFGYGMGNDDKNAGKAISYACKYGVLKGLNLETGDDPDDNQDTQRKVEGGASNGSGRAQKTPDAGKKESGKPEATRSPSGASQPDQTVVPKTPALDKQVALVVNHPQLRAKLKAYREGKGLSQQEMMVVLTDWWAETRGVEADYLALVEKQITPRPFEEGAATEGEQAEKKDASEDNLPF